MKMRMLLVLLVFGSNVAAASDEGEITGCDAPRSKVDQAVCADPELRGLRVRMEGLLDTIHAGTLHTNGDTGVMAYSPLKKQVTKSQVAWFKDMSRCQDRACMIKKFHSRIAALEGLVEKLP